MRRDESQYRPVRGTAVLMLMGLLLASASAAAQTSTPSTHSQPSGNQAGVSAGQDQDLQKQIAELRAQIAKLQTALDQQKQTPTAPSPASPQPAAGGMKGEMGGMSGGMKGEMGMMKGEMPMKGGMSQAPSSGASGGGMAMMDMDMHKGEMGMPPDGMKMPDNMRKSEMGMGSMSSGGSSAPASGTAGAGGMNMGGSSTPPAAAAPRTSRSMSSLPGVPGASHVYHVGSSGFFLDQPQLQLTTQQQAALNRIKERALLERANAERRIEQAEQELWTLTGADQPDATKVQAKLQEIERLRTDQRIGFIRAVGEATKQLTPEQQNVLLGTTASPK